MNPRNLPRGVVALGFVSLFMDTSSELIHSLLPAFLVSVLGAGALQVGIIEGIAEATASVTKVFSGALSDWIGRRKPLVLLGYGLAALTKPLFPLAEGIGAVLTARFLDRVGKGIRGAPRDALIADITTTEQRGAAYGLRQSMDTVGAFTGPLLAVVLMAASGDDFRFAMWFAVLPAIACVAFIVFGIDEPESRTAAKRSVPLRREEIARLPAHYWRLVAFASFLTLARFSEAFLLLRGQSLGIAPRYLPLVLIAMNLVYAASAYPLGHLADKLDRKVLLGFGIALLVAADIVLAHAPGAAWLGFGAALWGLHMGATQGLLSALVADAAPPTLRGTAFGIFNLATGVGLLAASVIAGALWSAVGPTATFYGGALCSLIALAGLARRAPAAHEGA